MSKNLDDIKSLLYKAIAEGDMETARWYFNEINVNVPLIINPPIVDATMNGQSSIIRHLASLKADLNQGGPFGTPLFYAKDAATINLLVSLKADINKPCDELGGSLIEAALLLRNIEKIQAFILAGADVNVPSGQSDNRTILQEVKACSYYKSVRAEFLGALEDRNSVAAKIFDSDEPVGPEIDIMAPPVDEMNCSGAAVDYAGAAVKL